MNSIIVFSIIYIIIKFIEVTHANLICGNGMRLRLVATNSIADRDHPIYPYLDKLPNALDQFFFPKGSIGIFSGDALCYADVCPIGTITELRSCINDFNIQFARANVNELGSANKALYTALLLDKETQNANEEKPVVNVLITTDTPFTNHNENLSFVLGDHANNIYNCMSEPPTVAEYVSEAIATKTALIVLVPATHITEYEELFRDFMAQGGFFSAIGIPSELTEEDQLELFEHISGTIASAGCKVEDLDVDMLILMDLSNSFKEYKGHVKSELENKFSSRSFKSVSYALSAFVDKPILPSGRSSDFCYRRLEAFSTDYSNFMDSYMNLHFRSGADGKEAQLEGVKFSLLDSNLQWRLASTLDALPGLRLIILATDSEAHVKGDLVGYPENDNSCNISDYPEFDHIGGLLERTRTRLVVLTSEHSSAYWQTTAKMIHPYLVTVKVIGSDEMLTHHLRFQYGLEHIPSENEESFPPPQF